MSIKKNLEIINDNIARACERSSRNRNDVKLIAVSKTVTDKEVLEAYECGQRDFAENRVQKFMEKYEVLSNIKDINWHIIGQLQTNKVKYCGDKVKLIHSVDRIDIAKELSKFAQKKDIVIHGLLEVNISGEASKTGMDVKMVPEFLDEFSKLSNIYIDGVMTMAPLEAEEKMLHEVFSGARVLSEKIKDMKIPNAPMGELSMGMSHDYEIAIEEGATMVRIGTAVFLK